MTFINTQRKGSKMVKQCKLFATNNIHISMDQVKTKAGRRDAKRQSKLCDKLLKNDWKSEEQRIKLLLLGPGEAGKSTLVKQMQLIHGEELDVQERRRKIPYIRQNVFDSMVAILVAMRGMGIHLADPELVDMARSVLKHSQVCDPQLSAKDILNSDYLASDIMIGHVQSLWHDEGIRKAYARSNEYQLLDCAAYFFERLDAIRSPDYIPSEQDVLRCRVMTTSITETKFTAPYGGQDVNFKVLDVGGQQGERRKWITLFDRVTAILFMLDTSSFDTTLREDNSTNRLLESLKVFHQTITTRYLRNVSMLTFMNKIDILKDKIEKGADFGAAMDNIREQALEFSKDEAKYGKYERGIYTQIYNTLASQPYSKYEPTATEKVALLGNSPFPVDENQNNVAPTTSFTKRLSAMITGKPKESAAPIISNDVIKAACYLRMILKALVDLVESSCRYAAIQDPDTKYRSYEFLYTCAIDKDNIRKVIDGCKNIFIRDHLAKMGIQLY